MLLNFASHPGNQLREHNPLQMQLSNKCFQPDTWIAIGNNRRKKDAEDGTRNPSQCVKKSGNISGYVAGEALRKP